MHLEEGTRIYIPIAGMDPPTEPTHEVVGHDGTYNLICPIGKLGEIQPGQDWVPVTRITEDRVQVL